LAKLLTKMQKYRLEHPKRLDDLSTQQKAALFRDVKKKAMLEIEELIFLARNLPERQLAKIFNSDILVPFMKTVVDVGLNPEKLGIAPSKWDRSTYLEFKNSKAFQKKRKRLLNIAVGLLSLVSDFTFVASIVPDPMRPYLGAEDFGTKNIRALHYYSMSEP
jgi:hypothetical protein